MSIWVFDKVRWSLFRRDGDERDTLVGGFEPDNLGSTLPSVIRLVLQTFPIFTLEFLFLPSDGRRRS